MTFAALRALHAIIGDAIDDIEHVYARASTDPLQSSPAGPSKARDQHLHSTVFPLKESSAYASPPPSPHVITPEDFDKSGSYTDSVKQPDFPSLDAPYDPNSPSELLTSDPIVVRAINHILAAAGQLSATVQAPFLSICDASMAYHLPSCIRLFEASHTVEILHEAGPAGLHVSAISNHNGVEESKLAHVLRLLATHHILREVDPDVFALNRISSVIDSGKSLEELRNYEKIGRPEMKYKDTNGIAAFTGLCADEIHKSSAYLTEAYFLSPSKHTREAREPTSAPFCFAFSTLEKRIGFFNWLEGEGSNIPKNKPRLLKSALKKSLGSSGTECGPGEAVPPALGLPDGASRHAGVVHASNDPDFRYKLTRLTADDNPNRFRLERFGKAMSGTGSWEAPGAIFTGFDWHLLPRNSVVVDVGGGIGSTSMLLATAFSSEDDDGLGLRFIIQDRPVVVEMGEKAWKAQCPQLLESGIARFQVHDFFTPQPVKCPAVFLLRVVLHDWPDDFARQILLQLRHAAREDTRLLIADFILPLACNDDFGRDIVNPDIDGNINTVVPGPLLANLGKASAMVYNMDLTMQSMFNSQERTLREIVTLTRSSGWKVVRVAKADGSHFGHITALPAEIPVPGASRTAHVSGLGVKDVGPPMEMGESEREIAGRAISRCGTPTFGSSTALPSFEEVIAKFGGRASKSRLPALSSRLTGKTGNTVAPSPPKLGLSSAAKKRPSPLSVPPLPHHISPSSPVRNKVSSPKPLRTSPLPRTRHASQSNIPFSLDKPGSSSAKHHVYDTSMLKSPQYSANGTQSPGPRQPTPSNCRPQPVPKSATTPAHRLITRRASHAQLYKPCLSPPPPLPSSIPMQVVQEPATPKSGHGSPTVATQKTPTMRRRASCANLTQPPRKRSDSLVPPLPSTPLGVSKGTGMGGFLSNSRGARLQFDRSDHDKHVDQPLGQSNALAAAAKIEKGFHVERSP